LARRPVGWPLSPAESCRFEALATPKRRREWLAGRLAAKRAVSTWLAEQSCILPPADIEIANEPSGKPVCRLPLGAAGPEISIAHAGGLAVCALSEKGPIGIDCEPVAAKTAGTLALVASGAELARSEFSPEAQTRLWCSKEAVLKLLGLGLSCDPREVAIEEGGARLAGAAQTRWEELGCPPIFLSERRLSRCMIVVAHTGAGGFDG
jgi:4'-phosphopantetheinyl transferase